MATTKNNIHVLSRAVIIDDGHLLVCKTIDLPLNFYFLPGGHVEHGESAETAIKRELLEETGVEGTVKRFLGCLEYSFEPGQNSICHNHEYNFFFEGTSEALRVGIPLASLESHIDLHWFPLSEIASIDLRPASLKTLLPEWLGNSYTQAFQSKMELG